MRVLCNDNDCTGCGLCKQICNTHAISMVADNLGFLHPRIDHSLCVECGLCALKCPQLNPVKRELRNSCYLAWANNEDIHFNSASGGISYMLAHSIISKGGFAVGCVWDRNFNAVLKVIDNVGDLQKTIGSKYVQSYLAEKTWDDIQQRLKGGKKGVFFGLPCQVAAIKSYTNNNDNLLLCDILCHGGCSPAYHHQHIEYILSKHNIDRFTDIRYRGGNFNFCYSIWNDNILKYNKRIDEDTYYFSFVRHWLFHDTCYKCQYANSNRISDITIGDFWGDDPNFVEGKNHLNGSNLVLVHTEKGDSLWVNIKDRIEAYQRNLDEAIKGNDTLKKPTEVPEQRTIILRRIEELGFEKAIKTSNDYRKKRKEIRRIKRNNLMYEVRTKIIPYTCLKTLKSLLIK